MPRLRNPFVVTLLTLALGAQPLAALACTAPTGTTLTDHDQDRMADFSGSRSQGLAEALVAEPAGDRAIVSDLFRGGDAALEALPDGRYRCRTIKLGGNLPLTVYGFFACEVSADGNLLDKTTGSQRFSGTLTPTEGALFYRGALHYADEAPKAYGDDPERNQVGCLYRVDDAGERYRLELPFPIFESTHDVIELVPAP